MSISYFCKDQLINIDHLEYKMVRYLDSNKWQLENTNSGEYKTYSFSDLLSLYSKKRLTFRSSIIDRKSKEYHVISTNSFDLVPKHEQSMAKTRYAYLIEAKNQKIHKYTKDSLDPIIRKVWNNIKKPETPPSWNTVYRWHRKLVESGNDIRGLVTRNSLKGNRVNRYPDKMKEIVETAISNNYLTRQKNTVTDTYYHAVHLINKYNSRLPEELHLPKPTRSYVQSLIEKIDAYDKCLARDGKQAATRKYRSTLNFIHCEKPLERVEIDHTQLDLFVVDENTALPLGRPWVTACMDVMTRSILGIYIGFEPPSNVSVSKCLQHAFYPKTYIQEEYPDIKNQWECYGAMETLVVDNGLEFHSEALENMCYPFGIDILYTPRKTPWFKPHIERHFRELNRNISHITPGTTFSNIFDKEDYDSTKYATVTLSTLNEMITTWIVDIYHQTPVSTTGISPAESWSANARYNEIALPSSHSGVDTLLGHIAKRTISHKGIELHGLRYNCQDLNMIRIKLGERVKATIRYDGADIGHIYVIHPETNEYIYVPALNQKYANGLGLWQHKICKRFIRDFMNDRKDIDALSEAKERIRNLIKKDFGNKGMKTRARAARFMEAPGKSSNTGQLELNLNESYYDAEDINIDTHDNDSFIPQKIDTVIESRIRTTNKSHKDI